MDINTNTASVFKSFVPEGETLRIEELSTGHINDTCLLTASDEQKYILQKINKGIFKDVPALIMNKVRISRHLHHKLSDIPEAERRRRILTFLNTEKGAYHVQDKNGEFWNATYYIANSRNYESVPNAGVALEGGKLFGSFLNLSSDFDASELTEVLPGFHDMSFRFQQFESALKNATEERLRMAKNNIDFAVALKGDMHILQQLKEAGKIRTRVTHNDTKISNALFDTSDKGLCVIDTDTVMPGIIHYDFGDAIRTICSTAREDEKNLDQIGFNKDFYEAYSQGFLEAVGETVSPLERSYFPLAAKTMIFIMGLRFLTDFLNNDIYYKTRYSDHNLVRSTNQFQLVKSFEEVMGPVI